MSRTLADLTDRHYVLFANNQHPMQLYAYEEYNRFLREAHDKGEYERYQELKRRFEEAKEERRNLLNREEGEDLSIDDITEIYMIVMGDVRNQQGFTLQTRSKDGKINDYLEVRRPFGAAE